MLLFLNLVVILVWGDLWHFAYSPWIEVPKNLLVYPLVLILCFVDVRLKHLSSIDDGRVVWVVRTIRIVHVWLATSSRAYLAWASIAYPYTLTNLCRRSSRCFLWPTNAYTGSLDLELPLWLLRAVKQRLLEVTETLHRFKQLRVVALLQVNMGVDRLWASQHATVGMTWSVFCSFQSALKSCSRPVIGVLWGCMTTRLHSCVKAILSIRIEERLRAFLLIIQSRSLRRKHHRPVRVYMPHILSRWVRSHRFPTLSCSSHIS